jgi:interferon alpha
MWRISPFSDLKDKNVFEYPQEEFDGKQVQKPYVISGLYEMTHQIYSLFNTKESSTA